MMAPLPCAAGGCGVGGALGGALELHVGVLQRAHGRRGRLRLEQRVDRHHVVGALAGRRELGVAEVDAERAAPHRHHVVAAGRRRAPLLALGQVLAQRGARVAVGARRHERQYERVAQRRQLCERRRHVDERVGPRAVATEVLDHKLAVAQHAHRAHHLVRLRDDGRRRAHVRRLARALARARVRRAVERRRLRGGGARRGRRRHGGKN
mmetsp:Transcript_45695/g.111984  ORF Transcript_45695/g.111984 Transcript_45695/m.111984 type:complete len:209 (+) Transcript_45695:1001-1627(+)